TSSTQYSVIYNFQSALSAGTLVHFQTAAGEEILTFASTKTYQSVVFSSPDLENGETYQLYTGGSSSGVETDGLYSDGIYSAGTQVTSFTISSMVTGSGGAGGGGVFPGGGPGRQRP
ncbi:MAG: dockerin type 1, partial [Anaerolineales bacterium]